jgi:hypothetical protein
MKDYHTTRESRGGLPAFLRWLLRVPCHNTCGELTKQLDAVNKRLIRINGDKSPALLAQVEEA